MQAPPGETPVLVTADAGRGWQGSMSLVCCVSCTFSYISGSDLSCRESQSDTASVLNKHCRSWIVSSALCTAKFHPVSITSTYSCKIYCRYSESSEGVINLLPPFVLMSCDHRVLGQLTDGPSPVVASLSFTLITVATPDPPARLGSGVPAEPFPCPSSPGGLHLPSISHILRKRLQMEEP